MAGLVSFEAPLRVGGSNPSFLRGFDGLLRGAWHRAALCADPLARNDGGGFLDYPHPAAIPPSTVKITPDV
jgi:hypothetical protein